VRESSPESRRHCLLRRFLIASTGRPVLFLIDVPKDVGLEVFAYEPSKTGQPDSEGLQLAAPPRPQVITKHLSSSETARRPLLYVGGGRDQFWRPPKR